MNWKNKIANAFGCEDKKFASHPIDLEKAAELLFTAIEENASYTEYVSAIKEWLESHGCSSLHIDKEIEKVESISSYFKYD